jgi:hypothetical protein
MRHLIPLLLATASAMPLAAEACGVDPHRPMLGVEMSPVPSGVQQQQGLSNDQGVLVRQTFGGTAADAMGLKSGDVILSVNGSAIGSMTDLRNEVGSQNVGDPVAVVVRRNGQDLALGSTIKEWPKNIPYDPIDAEAERRFRDWQQRRLGRQREDIGDLGRQLAEVKKDLEAPTAPGFSRSDLVRQGEMALRLLPPWTFSYEWTTAEIPPALGTTAPATPVGGDPWLAVAVMSTRFVEL